MLRSDTVTRLMRFIQTQERTIQTQMRRLGHKDSQIESYEHQLHQLRQQKNGHDYLISSYLNDYPNGIVPQQQDDYPHVGPRSHSQQEDYVGPRSPLNGLVPQQDPNVGPRNPLSDYPRVSGYAENNPNSFPNNGNVVRPVHSGNTSYENINPYDFPKKNVEFRKQHNNNLIPSFPIPQEVRAQPINLNAQSNAYRNFDGQMGSVRQDGKMHQSTPKTFSTDGSQTSEEKSNDSGVVIPEEILNSSTEERTVQLHQSDNTNIKEKIALLTNIDEILTRLIHEEEVIENLTSTINLMQSHHKLEKTELENDLKTVCEQHAMLIAEARSNDQQIRVLDSSASQKKKLIDALLQEEVDSDQQTKSLQAHLDYILHLPPTAFRLPEEGDDPPPLPPLPPAYPASLMQSLITNQPPKLMLPASISSNNINQNLNQTFAYNKISSSNINPSSLISPRNYVSRPPSPGPPLYSNRAPSPNLFYMNNRAPSPMIRNTISNRSCSPNHRKPRQPPPYHQAKNASNFYNKDVNANLNNLIQANLNPSLGVPKNNLKNMLSLSLPSLPDKIVPLSDKIGNSDINENYNSSQNINSRKESVSSDKTPPPLPNCPPPPLTPSPMNSIPTLVNDPRNKNLINYTDAKPNGLYRSVFDQKHIDSGHNTIEKSVNTSIDESIRTPSSRSSTASDNSTSNSSSGSTGFKSVPKPVKGILRTPNNGVILNNGKRVTADSADSNSDTGLSSLHSSSDEAVYTLDTLV